MNPLLAGVYSNATITDEYIYLSTPSTSNITIQMTYASGTGSPRISVTNLNLATNDPNYLTYNTTGNITISNANPVRLQFVTAANAIIAPGTTPTTVPVNTGGTTISGNTAGLKFTSSDNFFVNYRARSGSQAGSMLRECRFRKRI